MNILNNLANSIGVIQKERPFPKGRENLIKESNSDKKVTWGGVGVEPNKGTLQAIFVHNQFGVFPF